MTHIDGTDSATHFDTEQLPNTEQKLASINDQITVLDARFDEISEALLIEIGNLQDTLEELPWSEKQEFLVEFNALLHELIQLGAYGNVRLQQYENIVAQKRKINDLNIFLKQIDPKLSLEIAYTQHSCEAYNIKYDGESLGEIMNTDYGVSTITTTEVLDFISQHGFNAPQGE